MKKKKILFMFLMMVVLIGLFGEGILAQPSVSSVSGSIADRQTVTISGTGFGYHSSNGNSPSRDYDVFEGGMTYINSWWDDFDSYTGVCTGSPRVVDKYNLRSGDAGEPCDPRYDDSLDFNDGAITPRGVQSLRKRPSTSSIKMRPGSDYGSGEIRVYDTDGVWYWSMWIHIPSDYYVPDGNNQIKLVRMFDGGGVGGGEDFYPGITGQNGGTLGHHSDNDCSNCVSNTDYFFSVDSTVQGTTFRGYWHRFEIWADMGNDELLYYIDGHLYYDCNADWGSSCIPSDWSNSGIKFFSIAEVCTSLAYNYIYFDDIYVDNTWARVEISQTNEFTSDNTKKLNKALQLPRSWSDTEIIIDLNLEGLSGTVYLFIVNADGSVNPGYPITLGSGGDTTLPTRSNPSPTGNLSSGTNQTTISLSTNEVANCRYSITAGVDYPLMLDTFTNTDSTTHSELVTGLSNGNTYNYYVRCNDTSGNYNTDDFTEITFSVSTEQQTYHEADTNQDGCIDMIELIAYIGRWKNNDGVDMISLIEAIGIWKGEGC